MSRRLRRRPLVCLGALLGLLGADCRQKAPPLAPSHPNVLLISVDTLRADRLNTYGYTKRVVSPHIDALAKDGIVFERHVSAAPWTTPSHMSLLTSLNPTVHGVTWSFDELWDHLRDGGDFQRLADEHDTLPEVLLRSGYATSAFTGGLTLDPRIGFDQGFQSYDTSMTKLDDRRTAALVKWIDGQRRDAPFFVFWHMFEVHAPYLGGDFLPEVMTAEQAEELASRLDTLGRLPDPMPTVRQEAVLKRRRVFNREICSALYDGSILSADRWIGRILEKLKNQGLYDDMLIVLTSDHGEQLGEKATKAGGSARDARFFNAHGDTMYEEMIHVPLIVKLPGQRQAGRRVAALTRAIDVMPTILEIAAASLPAAMQGVSLRPLWEGAEPPGRVALAESTATDSEAKCLRRDQYKYIVSFDGEHLEAHGRATIPERPAMVELYDLALDPMERRNLLRSPSESATRVAARLDADLRELVRARVGTPARAKLDDETVERLKAVGYVE